MPRLEQTLPKIEWRNSSSSFVILYMKTKYPYSLIVLSALTLVATLSNFGGLRAAEDPFQMNVRNTEPLTPEEQLKKFHVPPGFEVQLVAADPEINKVTNLN